MYVPSFSVDTSILGGGQNLGLPPLLNVPSNPSAQKQRATFLEIAHRNPPGQATVDRYAQATLGYTNGSYLAISALMDGLRGATFTVQRKTKKLVKSLTGPQSDNSEWHPVEEDHPAAVLIRRPNGNQTCGDFEAERLMCLALFGTSLEWVVPAYGGIADKEGIFQPVERWVLRPQYSYACPMSPSFPRGYWQVNMPQPMYGYAMGSIGIQVGSEHVLKQFYGPNPLYPWDGYSPLTAGAQIFDVFAATIASMKNAMDTGFSPKAAIAINGAGPEEIERFKAQARVQFSGASGQQFLVGNGEDITVTPLNIRPDQMDYDKMFTSGINYILAAFGVPPMIAGLEQSGSYAQLYATLKQFAVGKMGQLTRAREEFLTEFFIKRWWPDCKLVIKLQKITDDETAIQRLQQLDSLQGVMFTVNQALAMNDMMPVEGGDVSPMEYKAMIAARVAEKYPPPAPAPMPGQPNQPAAQEAGMDAGTEVSPGADEDAEAFPHDVMGATLEAFGVDPGENADAEDESPDATNVIAKSLGRWLKAFGESDHPRDADGKFSEASHAAADEHDRRMNSMNNGRRTVADADVEAGRIGKTASAAIRKNVAAHYAEVRARIREKHGAEVAKELAGEYAEQIRDAYGLVEDELTARRDAETREDRDYARQGVAKRIAQLHAVIDAAETYADKWAEPTRKRMERELGRVVKGWTAVQTRSGSTAATDGTRTVYGEEAIRVLRNAGHQWSEDQENAGLPKTGAAEKQREQRPNADLDDAFGPEKPVGTPKAGARPDKNGMIPTEEGGYVHESKVPDHNPDIDAVFGGSEPKSADPDELSFADIDEGRTNTGNAALAEDNHLGELEPDEPLAEGQKPLPDDLAAPKGDAARELFKKQLGAAQRAVKQYADKAAAQVPQEQIPVAKAAVAKLKKMKVPKLSPAQLKQAENPQDWLPKLLTTYLPIFASALSLGKGPASKLLIFGALATLHAITKGQPKQADDRVLRPGEDQLRDDDGQELVKDFIHEGRVVPQAQPKKADANTPKAIPRPENSSAKGSLPGKVGKSLSEFEPDEFAFPELFAASDAIPPEFADGEDLPELMAAVEEKKKYGCLMAEGGAEHKAIAAKIAAMIDRNDLAEDGIEPDTHVTIRYGFHDGVKPEAIWKKLGSGKIPSEVPSYDCHRLGHFATPEYDVLFLSCENPEDWEVWHNALDSLPNTKTYAEYTPHMTVAYLKPGLFEKYKYMPVEMAADSSMGRVYYCDANKVETQRPENYTIAKSIDLDAYFGRLVAETVGAA